MTKFSKYPRGRLDITVKRYRKVAQQKVNYKCESIESALQTAPAIRMSRVSGQRELTFVGGILRDERESF